MGASSLRHIMCFSWFSANNKLSINGNRWLRAEHRGDGELIKTWKGWA
jgi:hypothetical protein